MSMVLVLTVIRSVCFLLLRTWYSLLLYIRGVLEKQRGCARYANSFYRREKSIAFYDVTISYGFENQISAFCDNYILFLHVFLSRHFVCDRFVKFERSKNFWLVFSLVQRMSVEQGIYLKFLVRLGKTSTEALKLLQEVYGDDTMSRTRLF